MYEYASDGTFDVNYRMVANVGKLRWAKPCVKQYQYGYFKSYIKKVDSEYYDLVSMLPMTKFNVNANTVYSESLGKI